MADWVRWKGKGEPATISGADALLGSDPFSADSFAGFALVDRICDPSEIEPAEALDLAGLTTHKIKDQTKIEVPLSAGTVGQVTETEADGAVAVRFHVALYGLSPKDFT